MTPHNARRTLPAVLLALGLGLGGCDFGLGGGYGNSGWSGYDAPPPQDPLVLPPVDLAPGQCGAAPVDLKGATSADVVATWQDWYGATYQITRFDADGTVTVIAGPDTAADSSADAGVAADGSADAGSPQPASPPPGLPPPTSLDAGVATHLYKLQGGTGAPQYEWHGHYSVNVDTLSITWDDGQTEVLTASFVSYPGCTMLTLTTAADVQQSRIPNANGELERVSCDAAQTAVGTVK